MLPQKLKYETEKDFFIIGEAWGDSSFPPVLLLHGVGQTKHSWGESAELLAGKGWYTIALDARGHGESDWSPDGIYKAESMVADLLAVIRSLPQKPALVGASMGGIISLLAEGMATESICSALVLVDIVPRPQKEGVQKILAFMSAFPEGFENFEKAAEAVSKYLPHRPVEEIRKRLIYNLRQKENGRFYWHWDPQLLKSFQEDVNASEQRTAQLYQAAKYLKVPVLAIRGGMSDVVSKEAFEEFLSVAPQIRSIDITGAYHMVAGDSNRIFTEEVVRFLEEVYPGMKKD